ncbi:hypothetical protein ACTXT7_003549 [Hymenolepis weldensis]
MTPQPNSSTRFLVALEVDPSRATHSLSSTAQRATTAVHTHLEFSTANNRNPSMGAYSHTSMDEVSTSLALDVTDLTAHCLRLEYVNETVSSLHPDDISNAPARLVLVGESSVPDDSGRVQTATRVWVVGQRAGRVRVKLSPVADSPLVKAALPTSLAKMRKQQHQQNQGKQNGWDAQQFQALWVTVTDNDAVWPVGITAQLVTDLTVTITQQERSESKYSTTPFYHQSNDIERVESSFKFYTTHIRFSGSRVGRSKGFPMISNSGAAPDAFAFQGGDQFPDLSRAKRQLATKTLPRQGLLVVTVQFSDGSVLPWHRIMENFGHLNNLNKRLTAIFDEAVFIDSFKSSGYCFHQRGGFGVMGIIINFIFNHAPPHTRVCAFVSYQFHVLQVVWELRQQEAPFTLAVENLRPDLVRVDMPPMPTSSPSPTPAQSRHKRSSIAADPQLFGYHGDATTAPVSEAKNKTDPPPSRPEWFGPTVFLLREDESFIGKPRRTDDSQADRRGVRPHTDRSNGRPRNHPWGMAHPENFAQDKDKGNPKVKSNFRQATLSDNHIPVLYQKQFYQTPTLFEGNDPLRDRIDQLFLVSSNKIRHNLASFPSGLVKMSLISKSSICGRKCTLELARFKVFGDGTAPSLPKIEE